MSFELGLLMGLGRSAVKERETRTQQEKLLREQEEEQSKQSLALLQKLVETDNLLPDQARNLAAQRWTNLAMNPKAKPKDHEAAISEIWQAANQPRATPQTVAANAVRTMSQPDYSFLNGIAPGMGTATNEGMQQIVPQLPTSQFNTGILTRDEVNSRQEADMRRRLAIQQEYSGAKVTPFSPNQGLYDNGANQVIREPTPKPPAPRRLYPLDVLLEGAKTPEDRIRIAQEALDKQYTNQGDTPRPASSGNSMGPAMMLETPNGPQLVFPRLMNPSAQGMVPLPEGTAKPMTGGTKPTSATGSVGSVAAKRIFDMEQKLTANWTKANADQRAMKKALSIMESGFQRFEQDPNGSSQATLVTFQKALDSISVVRESEYARSAEGISLLSRVDGWFQRHSIGGAGVPREDLKALVDTARAIYKGMDNFNKGERARIEASARDFGLNPSHIFDDTSSDSGPKIGEPWRTRDGRRIVVKALSPDGRQVIDYDVVP